MDLFDVVSCERRRLPEFLLGMTSEALKRKVIRVEEFDQRHFKYPRHTFGLYTKADYSLDIVCDHLLRKDSVGALNRNALLDTMKNIFEVPCSHELPTVELRRVLTALITAGGSRKLREVGAGNALLSRMLATSLTVPITATDKFVAPQGSTFVPVRAESFEETVLESGEDVLVSWLHPSTEKEFLLMVERNLPTNVWLVGQLENEDCFTGDFVAHLRTLGYGYLPVTAKQFSFMDCFIGEGDIGVSHTSTAWFSLRPFPELAAICDPRDLGSYRPKTRRHFRNFIETIIRSTKRHLHVQFWARCVQTRSEKGSPRFIGRSRPFCALHPGSDYRGARGNQIDQRSQKDGRALLARAGGARPDIRTVRSSANILILGERKVFDRASRAREHGSLVPNLQHSESRNIRTRGYCEFGLA
jgi:hypothetical protein